MQDVTVVRKSAKNAKGVQNECDRMHTHMLSQRLYALWVSRRVIYNGVQPTLYRYHYFELVGVFILGRNSLQE